MNTDLKEKEGERTKTRNSEQKTWENEKSSILEVEEEKQKEKLKRNIEEAESLGLLKKEVQKGEKFTKVYFQQPDLDTIGTAYLMAYADKIDKNAEWVVLKTNAAQEILDDKNALCIECGGSGEIDKGNFDHHNQSKTEINKSASFQALEIVPREKINFNLVELVNYINELDIKGLQNLYEKEKPQFPTLPDIIAGIRLKYGHDPKMVLTEGIKVLEKIIKTKQNPYGTIDGFEEYADIKKKNDEEIEKVKENVQFKELKNGLIVGYLQTEFFGALGIIYEEGKKRFGQDKTVLAVAFNPNFGPNKDEKKFTIGLSLTPEEAQNRNINLTRLTKALNLEEAEARVSNFIKRDEESTEAVFSLDNLEQEIERMEKENISWGGPASGTIIGSPRGGSALNLREVITITEAIIMQEIKEAEIKEAERNYLFFKNDRSGEFVEIYEDHNVRGTRKFKAKGEESLDDETLEEFINRIKANEAIVIEHSDGVCSDNIIREQYKYHNEFYVIKKG